MKSTTMSGRRHADKRLEPAEPGAVPELAMGRLERRLELAVERPPGAQPAMLDDERAAPSDGNVVVLVHREIPGAPRSHETPGGVRVPRVCGARPGGAPAPPHTRGRSSVTRRTIPVTWLGVGH